MAKKMVASIKQTTVPAALWKRAIAYVIDSFIVTLIVGVPFNSLIRMDSTSVMSTFKFFTSNPEISTKFFLISMITAVLAVLYWAILEFKYKQSIGKLLLKIDVRSLQKELTFGQCFLRNVSKVSTLVLALDCLYIIITKSHQRYLEKASNTEVVEIGWKI